LIPIDRFAGFLYRALNPVYARDPLSGRGAQLYGGRFNPKGTPALYASLSPMTALREANQVGTLQPTTLVAYVSRPQPRPCPRPTIRPRRPIVRGPFQSKGNARALRVSVANDRPA